MVKRRKMTQFNQISNKISRNECRDSEDKRQSIGIKKHSDQIQLEISTASQKDDDIESIEQELADMSDTWCAEARFKDVQEEKYYVDVLREILNDKGAKAKIIRKYVPIMNQLINKYLQQWTSMYHLI